MDSQSLHALKAEDRHNMLTQDGSRRFHILLCVV